VLTSAEMPLSWLILTLGLPLAVLPRAQQHEDGTSAASPRRGPHPGAIESTPAFKYGRMDRASCELELVRRKIPFTRVPGAKGVLAPVRLAGPLHGVSYRTELPAKMRPSSPYEIYDCRLVLALDDFSAILAKLDVVEVVHFSAYRPPGRRFPDGRVGARHDGGLALDAGKFVKKDGTVIDVLKDFNGKIGARTCGDGAQAPDPATPESKTLRTIACEAADAHLFNVLLTPHNDWAHRNHFHLEVTKDAKWFIVK
jgi:hypothetical protein